jgi:DNA-binding transcriptional LysR family regulator
MNDRLSALRLFVTVARRGSFSKGGKELSIPQPTVSRVISTLEREIGAVLFARTTRSISLTARIEPLLAAIDAADQAVRSKGEIRGLLRVGLSSSFALREIVPRLPRFMERHPALRVELVLDDQRQDFVSDAIDMGLRFGTLPNSRAVARRIGAWSRILAASPYYLRTAGMPKSPGDLLTHQFILGPARGNHSWSFSKDGKTTTIKVDGRLAISVNEVALAAAVAGLGIVTMTSGACRREMENGQLVRVLSDWDMGVIEAHAVFAASRAIKPSARAFADFLCKEFVTQSEFR